MAKSDLTIQLERGIWHATKKQGTFGCFEVTIGWFGKERVDYVTFDTKNIWRCYEIKATKADFRSKNHNTFIGHLNYYVLPKTLYDEIKKEIPSGIGAFLLDDNGCVYCIKRATRRELKEDEQIMKNSMIRSLCREYQKQVSSNIPTLIEKKNWKIRELERQIRDYKQSYCRLQNKYYALEQNCKEGKII